MNMANDTQTQAETKQQTTTNDVQVDKNFDGKEKNVVLAADKYGCILNPTPQHTNQLVFGDVLRLERVEPGAWKNNLGLNCAWSSVDAALFMIRGKQYLTNKKKIQSEFSIYDPVGIDILTTKKRWFCSSDAFWHSKVPQENVINGMPTKLTIEITFPIFDAGK